MSCCVKMNVGPGGTRHLTDVGMSCNCNCVLSNTFLNAKLDKMHFETLGSQGRVDSHQPIITSGMAAFS